MSADDLRIRAEKLDHEIVNLSEDLRQAEKTYEHERARIETDIAAAQSKIDSLTPYAQDSIEHTGEIHDWQRRIDVYRQQWERESMRISSDIEQLRRELETKKSQSTQTWAECESAKATEARQRAAELAARAQDPNTGTTSDQLAA